MAQHGAIENYCDLPYAAEYARSDRSKCKRCKGKIGEGALRLSAREPSRFFDGIQDNWYHVDCFFTTLGRGTEKINEKSIRGIEVLRWDDQERIRHKIAEIENGCPIVSDFAGYKAEYSKTNKGKCYGCKKNFEKQELKIGKKSSWYHHGCAIKSEVEATLEGEPDDIKGFAELKEEDQKMLKQTYGKNKGVKVDEEAEVVEGDDIDVPSGSGVNNASKPKETDSPPAKKYRFGKNLPKKDPKELHKEQMKKQTDLMWDLRNELEKLDKQEKRGLLEANELVCPEKEEDMLELLVDSATFGKPLRCPSCNTGEVIFSLSARTYTCLGYMSEYTKCPYTNKNPVRSMFSIPREMQEKLSYLCHQKLNVLTSRVYPLFEEEEEVIDRSVNKVFAHLGARQLKNVAEAYVDGKKERKSTTGQRIIKMGTVVDAECKYAQQSHVESDDDGSLFSVELSKCDLISNINSYYRMQLLKDDYYQSWYLFRSWGRVGTDIGSLQDQEYRHKDMAVNAFCRFFEDKTGNKWEERDHFQKKAGFFDWVQTDYSEFLNNSGIGKEVPPGSQTTLPRAVVEIIKMISDVEAMKQDLTKFHLDTTKMPLGKLSKQQLKNAYSVLSELQNMLESNNAPIERIYDCTNRFYTLVPHDFGMKQADVLDNLDIIKDKCRMIDALMDIQLAFKVAHKGQGLTLSRDPVDVNYENLKCEMEVVDPKSQEFKIVEKYFVNTHGRTHGFKIKITDVLRLNREGEDQKFTWNIGNRKLLWHGSRTTNFMGILSQGLRIAPPEAPVSGYMFGKGVYFADMVSKSAQYCRLHDAKTENGLILLCDVALGNMQEERHAKNIVKPQAGFSSVKGPGRYYPTDSEKYADPIGFECSFGKTAYVPDPNNYSLDYNEYIVYNTDQIRMRYLVRFSFR